MLAERLAKMSGSIGTQGKSEQRLSLKLAEESTRRSLAEVKQKPSSHHQRTKSDVQQSRKMSYYP